MNGKKKLEEAAREEFVENPEPRCPCVLLLDTSGSMTGEPIAALNEGLRSFRKDLEKDTQASLSVEVAIVAFDNNIRIIQDFVTVDNFEPPTLTAQGLTYMGSAIKKAIEMVQDRKAVYKKNVITYFRPWIFLITDGEPQGEAEEIIVEAAKQINDGENTKRFAFFAVGVEGANMERLKEIAVRPPKKLKGLEFRELFLWLSQSLTQVSHSKEDEQVSLPTPGWEQV